MNIVLKSKASFFLGYREMGTGVTTFVFKAETKVLLGRIGPPLDTQDAISRPGWILNPRVSL